MINRFRILNKFSETEEDKNEIVKLQEWHNTGAVTDIGGTQRSSPVTVSIIVDYELKISDKRRVSVNDFNGQTLVNPRILRKMDRCYRERRFVPIVLTNPSVYLVHVFFHCTSNPFPHRKPLSTIKKHTSLPLLLLPCSQPPTHKVNQASH